MSGQQLTEHELSAGNAVADVLQGRAIPRDIPGAPPGTHDFDIELEAGRRIALEVTSAADSSIISQREAAFGREWPAPGLEHDWWVSLRESRTTEPHSIARMMRQVPAILAVLQDEDVNDVETRTYLPPTTPPRIREATEELRRLDVAAAHRLGAPKNGEALVLLGFRRGASANPDAVNELVAERAKAKLEKLLRSGADERHLYVWIDSTRAEADLAMATLPPPSSGPALPAGIDMVWAATFGWASQPERLWRASPGGAWEVILHI